MKKIIFLLSVFVIISCNKKNDSSIQQVKSEKGLKPVSEFYSIDRAQVLVVGTFHFNYPGLDELKTEESDLEDIFLQLTKSNEG